MKHFIKRLDVMIAYSCNISCRGCISLSDRKRTGIENYDNLTANIYEWSQKLVPEVVTVFGGEPLLHNKIIDICKDIRTAWPNATIRLITNGLLLYRIDPNEWFQFSPFELQISVHRSDHEPTINAAIRKILQCKDGWTTTNKHEPGSHEQIAWSIENFRVYKSIFGEFIEPYRMQGSSLVPWNSNPTDAHAICGAPDTPILYKGKLYKCPAVANIIDITGENWFGYQPVSINDNIEEFVSFIGRPETVCGQCPNSVNAVRINHLDPKNVTTRSANSN